MARVVILKTDQGIQLLGSTQSSNGAYFDAEGCFRYCNENKSEQRNRLQATKLSYIATLLAYKPKSESDWYKHRENFIDTEVKYECDQSYKKE